MRVKHSEPQDNPLLTTKQFLESPEFRKFKGIMRKLLKVSKSDLDEMVKSSKEGSPRAGIRGPKPNPDKKDHILE